MIMMTIQMFLHNLAVLGSVVNFFGATSMEGGGPQVSQSSDVEDVAVGGRWKGWAKVAAWATLLQAVTIGLIAVLTYSIVQYHQESVVVGGFLTAQGDKSGTPLGTARVLEGWTLSQIRVLPTSTLRSIRTLAVPVNGTSKSIQHVAKVDISNPIAQGTWPINLSFSNVAFHTKQGHHVHVEADHWSPLPNLSTSAPSIVTMTDKHGIVLCSTNTTTHPVGLSYSIIPGSAGLPVRRRLTSEPNVVEGYNLDLGSVPNTDTFAYSDKLLQEVDNLIESGLFGRQYLNI